MSVSASVYVSVSVSVPVSVYARMFVCLSLSQPRSLSGTGRCGAHLPLLLLSIYLSIDRSVYLFIYLSNYLFIYLWWMRRAPPQILGVVLSLRARHHFLEILLLLTKKTGSAKKNENVSSAHHSPPSRHWRLQDFISHNGLIEWFL